MLTGVDLLTACGLADPAALFLFGHSYGGYLAGGSSPATTASARPCA